MIHNSNDMELGWPFVKEDYAAILQLTVIENQCLDGVNCTNDTYRQHASDRLWHSGREGPLQVTWVGHIMILLAKDDKKSSYVLYKLRRAHNTPQTRVCTCYTSIHELLDTMTTMADKMLMWYPHEVIEAVYTYMKTQKHKPKCLPTTSTSVTPDSAPTVV